MSRFLYLIAGYVFLSLLNGASTAAAAPTTLRLSSVWPESFSSYRYGCARDGLNRSFVVRLGSGRAIVSRVPKAQLTSEARVLRRQAQRLGTGPRVQGRVTRLRTLAARLPLGCAPSSEGTPAPGSPTPQGTPIGTATASPIPTLSTPPPLFTVTPLPTQIPITPTPTATPPPGSWPSGSPSGNCIEVMNVDSFGSNLVPIQLARPFLQGEIPNYPAALENGQLVATQSHVQSRYPDGTVKHAILIFYTALSVGQTKTICFGNTTTTFTTGGLTTTDMLSPALNFDARVQISGPAGSSSASARTALQQGDVATWFSGLGATSVVIGSRTSSTYDLGFGAARPVRPMWYVTFFPLSGAARIRVTAETTNSQALGDLNYDVAITLGNTNPQTVYQKSEFTHFARTVWTKEYWIGNRPPRLAIKQNVGYLASTKMLPNYDSSIEVNTTSALHECNTWLNAPKDIGDRGNYLIDMGTSGGRGELGLLPRWTVMYLYTGSACLADAMYEHANLAGAWPMFLREGDTSRFFDHNMTVPGAGRFLSIYSRPTFWINGQAFNGNSADRVTLLNSPLPNSWKVDWAHMPEVFSVPWLLSGDKFYLEMLQGQALSNIVGRQPGNNWLTRGPYNCFNIGTDGQTRQDAWLLRTMATAAAYSPDGTIEKSELQYRTECMLAAWAGAHNIANPYPAYAGSWNWAATSVRFGTGGTDCGLYGSNPYPICRNPFSGSIHYWAAPATAQVTGHVTAPTVVLPWQYNYLIISLARAKDLGFNTNGLIEWVGKFTTDQLLTPGYDPYLAGEYYFSAHDPVSLNYLSNLTQVQSLYTPFIINNAQAGFLSSLGGVEHSYAIILRMALEMMEGIGQAPQARATYAQMIAGPGLSIPFQTNPQWAVVGRL